MSLTLATNIDRKTLETARIVIVGAGPSGIATATKLLEAGFQNVILLESENRIGGRINTIPFADNVIDLGAQWCHGEKNNVIYETLQEKKLNLLESTGHIYQHYKCIRSNKEIVDENIADPLKTIAIKSIPELEDELEIYEGSLGSFISEKFWSEVSKLPLKVDHTVAREFLENLKKLHCTNEGSDNLFEVSGKGTLEYSECEGDQMLNWQDKGFKSFLDILMKSDEEKPWGLLEKRVLLNHRVRNIDWSHKDQIKIKCINGQIIMADHVVCTTSLGVLKENHTTMFKPSLPQPKILAIEGLTFGTVDKFFIEFKEPFGPSDWSRMSFLWLEEDLKILRNSKYFWLESACGFFRVAHQPRILEGWIIGPHARYMESLAENEVLEGILWLFRKFLSFPIPEPLNFLRTQWHSNVSFRGSYSFRSMLTEELRTGAWDLATPLTDDQGKPRLQFAGEATSNHHYSAVHGAVESGWREAQRLVDFYKDIPAQL